MRRLGKRDVPLGAAITIAALVLLASAVTGREDPAAPAAEPAAAPAQPAASDDLDLERLRRTKKESQDKESAPQDLFATRASLQAPVAPPPVLDKPAPPPAPSAPPLPFKYLGRMVDSEKIVVFLERNQDSLSASVGDTLDNTYQVESIGESAVHFVYLPLGTKQVLGIPAPY